MVNFDQPTNMEIKKSWKDMSFAELENDAEYESLIQELSLRYMKEHKDDYFNDRYTGELDAKGYLIRRDGESADTKPSMVIAASGWPWVLEELKKKLGE